MKRNAFSLACFLLAVLVSFTGTVSYSRYLSSSPNYEEPILANFDVSGQIDHVSALSFTNTAFWGGTSADDRIAMNALRSIEFSVNNFKVIRGVEKVAEVKTAYRLVFVAPKNFIERMAFQVFDVDEDPMIPQFVVEDFFNEINLGHDHYNTAESVNYHGVETINDMVFEAQKLSETSFKAVGYNNNGKVTIKFDLHQAEMHQQLLFRTWDCWDFTDEEPYYIESEEGGDLLPPLTVNYTNLTDFYTVTVSMDRFFMPGGVKTVKEHCIHLTPTHPLHDHHLGSYFVEDYVDENGTTQTRRIQSIYGGPDAQGNLKDWTLKTIHENVTNEYYVDDRYENGTAVLTPHGTPKVEQMYLNVMGNKTVYNLNEERTEKSSATTTIADASPHMGGIWEHSYIVEDGPYEDDGFEYIYLHKETSEEDGRPIWRVVGPGDANDYNKIEDYDTGKTIQANQNYFRIKVDPKTSKRYTAVSEKITEGPLIETINVSQSYKVRSVEILPTGQEKIVLEMHETVDTTEIVKGEAVRTTGVKYNFDYIMGNIEQYVKTTGKNPKETWQKYNRGDFDIFRMVYREPSSIEYVPNCELEDNFHEDSYYVKTIIREEHSSNIKIESVEWSVEQEDGSFKPVTFTYDSPFVFFEKYLTPGGQVVDRERIFLSQCYSKNYPFSVNILFEQLIE